jgi:beta-glucosidase
MENKFPEGFLWGSATSSYQVEGGIDNNDWSEAAATPSGKLVFQGRSAVQEPKRVDVLTPAYSKNPIIRSAVVEGLVPIAGRACDSYNRFEEDFDIAKTLDQNAHRLSIEWARIEPEEGKFDEKEIEHYKKVLNALRGRGIEPFVTIWHFTLPIWFSKMGGFENVKSPEIFSRYCEKIVEALGDRVKYWVTINEPMVYASNGYRKGQWPPFQKNIFRFMKVVNNLVMSHNLAYDKIKNVDPSAQIGIAKNNINFESNWNPFNRLLSSFLNFFWNFRFLNKISQDFIGLNYYFHKKFGDRERHQKSDTDWDVYPKGIFDLLVDLKKYKKPVYITENGIADRQDKIRSSFIRNHLKYVIESISKGVDVRGYFYWSLLDNYEWKYGFDQKFGLVEVNFDTMERKIRSSAFEYARICRENSLI